MSRGDEPLRSIPAITPEEIEAAQPPPTNDPDTGTAEAKLLSKNLTEEEIRKRSQAREADRTERFRDEFERIALVGLWVLALAILALFLVWFWHLVAPEAWRWLSDAEIGRVQSIVLGGVLASFALGHIRKRLGG